jgi:thioredoxin 1
MSQPLELSAENFAEKVLESKQPVLVDVWAAWCGPCRALGPVVEEIAEEFEGRAVVAKLDADRNSELAAQLGIRALPTLLFFKDGQIVDKIVGLVARGELSARLANLLTVPPELAV